MNRNILHGIKRTCRVPEGMKFCHLRKGTKKHLSLDNNNKRFLKDVVDTDNTDLAKAFSARAVLLYTI